MVDEHDRASHRVKLLLPAGLIRSDALIELHVPCEPGDIPSWVGKNLPLRPMIILIERCLRIGEADEAIGHRFPTRESNGFMGIPQWLFAQSEPAIPAHRDEKPP